MRTKEEIRTFLRQKDADGISVYHGGRYETTVKYDEDDVIRALSDFAAQSDTDTILIIAMDHVWNTHVLPLHEELKSTVDEKWEVISDADKTIKQLQADNKLLREEIERLKAEVLREKFPPN